MSKVYTKKILTDMVSKTYSCNILLSKALIISFYLTSSNVAYATPCTTQGGIQNILSASGGLQCETNVSGFSGANVVTVVDDGSSITFTAPVTTIVSNYNSTTALGINGGYRLGTAGATVNANNLIVYSGFGQNSSAIYIAGSDVNKPDTLNVTGDLTLYGRASQGGAALRSGGSGTLVKVSGLTSITTTNQDAIRNAGDMFFNNVSLTMNNGGRAIVNTKNISIDGDLTVNANNGLLINQDGGSLSIGGVTALNKTGTGTAINNINNSLIFFNDNVTLVNSTTAINNNSSEINFFGLVNNLKGNVNNLNNGLINLSNGQLGGQLTIDGDYVGTNGVVSIDTKLSNDISATDKLIIVGDATGSSELKVNNVGGNGAQTSNGIHVIQTGSSEANAFFIANGGYLSAGAYDYGLYLEHENNLDNWYLRSHLRDKTPTYTPDIGSYLAVETMGNTLFTSRIEDREGASQYQNLDNKNEGNVWVRAYGGHNKFTTMDSQLKTTGNSFVTQIGAGLVTLGEEDQYNLGAMTGFATYDGKTHSNLTDRGSKTKINGYSLGLYGTWYAHPVEKRGAYIDTWVLWNKFNNKIDTPDQNYYKYDSSGITASIEVGGDYLINKNGKKNWWIQPQSQVIYQGVHADDFKDAQGVDIYHGKDNVQARMGVKTYLNIPTSGNKITSYRPYVALNFIHNTSPYSVVIDDVRYENQGSANLGEIKVGVEGHITNNSQVWLNASYVAGSHDNEVYQGNIGWKYNF